MKFSIKINHCFCYFGFANDFFYNYTKKQPNLTKDNVKEIQKTFLI